MNMLSCAFVFVSLNFSNYFSYFAQTDFDDHFKCHLILMNRQLCIQDNNMKNEIFEAFNFKFKIYIYDRGTSAPQTSVSMFSGLNKLRPLLNLRI